MPLSPPRGPLPARVLRLYALATLDHEGSVYGYSLAERIAVKTDGAWRPGPGAIYPALQSLVERKWARSEVRGQRRVYAITPAGHGALRRIRAQMAGGGPGAPDLTLLWAEIAGSSDVGDHLLRRLHRTVDAIEVYLSRTSDPLDGGRTLRSEAIAELEGSLRRLTRRTAPSRRPRGRGAR